MSYGTSDVKYQPAKGTGSILSDDKWTPMLNDSFMLGGIHSGADFQLAEEFFHSKTARLGNVSPKDKWLHFFQQNKLTFWAPFGPRVFARECICLKAAGYKPNFANHGLVFTGGGGSIDFAKCLRVVNTSGLTNKNMSLTMQSISEFLFDDRNALKY